MTISDKPDFLRRSTIKSALVSIATLSVTAINAPLKASENKQTAIHKNAGLTALVATLRLMEKDVCDTAAINLETSLENGSALNLHLRNAGLDLSNALDLAEALKNLPSGTKQPLVSFSVSYNPQIGDSGVMTLARSLPLSLQEVGFVECNMHDAGGKAILQWANKARNLKMICIERNKLQKDTRVQFQEFSQSNPKITIIF